MFSLPLRNTKGKKMAEPSDALVPPPPVEGIDEVTTTTATTTRTTTTEEDRATETTTNNEGSGKKETAIPKAKKTWATSSLSSISSTSSPSKPKQSLLSIMAQEEKLSREEKQKQDRLHQQRKAEQEKRQEEYQIQQAIQASKQEEDDLLTAMRLSMMEMNTPNTTAAAAAYAIESDTAATAAAAAPTAIGEEIAAAASVGDGGGLSPRELALIEQALQEADAEETNKSLLLAMQLQSEEDSKKLPATEHQGNVRTISRAHYLAEQQFGAVGGKKHFFDQDDPWNVVQQAQPQGFRMNTNHAADEEGAWTRLDGNTIIGPNNEIRTKHDVELQGLANAHRLQLDLEDFSGNTKVGNKAFNSFKQTMQKSTKKGVATSGQGRAQTDSEKTKQGALDSRVRIHISKAINNGMLNKLNGCVKEGKEALVYHGEEGRGQLVQEKTNTTLTLVDNKGFDVAVKIFKRIQEFRNRGQYVDGDPRYDGKEFSRSSERRQLEMWAEKEFRNLVRAHRAGVPVPKPLHYKENVLFLRFLGQDGWPSPQLRELTMKKGSKKWKLLYEQTMEAVQKLYTDAKLVHGDLSEYNIMVCPSKYVSDNTSNVVTTDKDGEEDSLRIALIDFGQAVDLRHPDATTLLERDLSRVKHFFDRMGITTLSITAAMKYCGTQDARFEQT